jgi:N,N'-diacetyllegionaminate synthase
MSRVFIIAEAGVNHNGSIEIAKKLVDTAKKVGADAIKFQSFKAEKIVVKKSEKANYQKASTGKSESQYEMLKRLELSEKEQLELLKYSERKKIIFLSSPFDLDSIDFLNKIGIDTFKIPSGEITNLPYLRKIGNLKAKIILSTGMAFLNEIEDAVKVLVENGTNREDITILHCNTEYPTPFDDVNLNAMMTIKNKMNFRVGYSDHTLGSEVSVAAVALGAEVIEKHFTLDKNMDGPDHKASLNPDEFEKFVNSIRNIECALGDGIKKPSKSEAKNIGIVRKSIVAAVPISSGDIYSEKNITVKRPGNGISPMQWDKVLGKIAKKNFNEDDLIEI